MIKTLPQNQDVFLARVAKLPDYLSEFEEILHVLAAIQIADVSLATDTVKLITSYESLHFAIKAAAKRLQPRPVNNVSTNRNTDTKPRLAPINMSKFNGKIEEFSAFPALFDTLLHSNTSLTNIEKYFYLEANLEGPALQLLQTVEFCPETYDTAYKLLIDRYTNKRVMGKFYLYKLLNLQPLKSPKDNKNLVDIITTTVTSIKSLGIADLADFILLCRSCVSDLIGTPSTSKADTSTARERRVFLTNETDVLRPPSSASKPTAICSTNSSCLCCKKDFHKLGNCSFSFVPRTRT